MSRPRHECHDTCGSMDKMQNVNERQQRYVETNEHRDMLETMDELCGYQIVLIFISNSILAFMTAISIAHFRKSPTIVTRTSR